jgi:hypothetical protein
MTDLPIKTRRHGRRLVLFGVLFAVAGVSIYAAQVALHRLFTPWYLPCLAALSVVFVAAALFQTRTGWRWLALAFVVVLATGQFAFVFATRLPAYTGPVAVGKPFPSFSTQVADGTPFTQRDLQSDQPTVLVFFRGRW